jgi:hypothetical protein
LADGCVLRSRPPEILFCGAAAHVGANLGQQTERILRADAVDLRKIGPGQLVERRAEIKARFVALRLLAPARRGKGRGGRGRVGRESGQMAFDRRVARG